MEPDEQHLPNHVIMKCKMLLWVTGLYGRARDRSLLMSYPGQPRLEKAVQLLRNLNLNSCLESFSESEKCCIRLDFLASSVTDVPFSR